MIVLVFCVDKCWEMGDKKRKGVTLLNFFENCLTGNLKISCVVTDSAYCYYCRAFCDSVPKGGDAFTKTGYKNWKNRNCLCL